MPDLCVQWCGLSCPLLLAEEEVKLINIHIIILMEVQVSSGSAHDILHFSFLCVVFFVIDLWLNQIKEGVVSTSIMSVILLLCYCLMNQHDSVETFT